jgi:two-component system, response regulator
MTDNEVEILLVEDNPSDAELTIRALKRNNLANFISHVKDGAAALEFIFGDPNAPGVERTPKVILLDLKLPKVNGLEVLERLKANPRTRSIPTVVLTSSREDTDLKRCYELGVNSYIVKPVEFESFVTAISKLGLYWLLLNETPQS